MKTSIAVLVAGALLVLANPVFAKKRPPPGVAVKWKEVPAAVQSAVQTNAGDAKVKEVRKESANGVVYYFVEIKAADGQWSKIYVKEDGTLMRTEPDNVRNKRKHKPLFGG
jgi:hypothetical protein